MPFTFQCGTIPSFEGILEVLEGINILQNDAVIRKNAVSDNTIMQKVPLSTWPLYQKHLYLHGHYTRSTYTWLLYNNHLHQYGSYTGVTFTYMAVKQENL